MRFKLLAFCAATPLLAAVGLPVGATTYLNAANIAVAVGSGTSPGSFNNTFDNGATISKVIDAPSADALEFHNQATHIWFTADAAGGGLELRFDFQREYDLSVLHFWNYTDESFDVDTIGFTFFNQANAQVGAAGLSPALGTSPGITSQDIVLTAPLNVRYVTAFLTGSNRQVDFQNIGFTANVSAPIPEPGQFGLFGLGGLALLWRTRRACRPAGTA